MIDVYCFARTLIFLIPVSPEPRYVAYYTYAELLENVCLLYAKTVSHIGPFFPNGRKREESFFKKDINNAHFIRRLISLKIHAYKNILASARDFGNYRICEQRKIRRACAYAQSRLSLCLSRTQRQDIAEGPD